LKDEFEKKMQDGENYIQESRGVIVEEGSLKLPNVKRSSLLNNVENLLPPP